MGCLPSGAVCRDNHCRTAFFEGGHRRRNNSLKKRSGEMKSADHGVDGLDAGQSLGMANRIDDSRVPAAREDNESLVFDMQYDRLVVMNEGVRPPLPLQMSVVHGKPLLKRCRALELSRHQYQAAEQVRRSPLLDKLDAFSRQHAPIRRRNTHLAAIWKNDLPLEECVRMQQQRHPTLP